MRAEPSWRFNAVQSLLITLGVLFFLQCVGAYWFRFDALTTWGQLSWANLMKGFVWTPLTYGFLHATGSIWHVFFNGLMLFWTGRWFEDRFGPARLLETYALGVLAGGIFFLGAHYFNNWALPVVGASGAVMGLFTLFYIYNRDAQISIFGIFSLPIAFVYWIYLSIDLFVFLFQEIPGGGNVGVAGSAHVGGAALGYLYHRYLIDKPTLTSWVQGLGQGGGSSVTKGHPVYGQRFGNKRIAVKGKSPGLAKPGKYKVNVTQGAPVEIRAEVDRILDKINREGFGALTDDEKKTLDRAGDALK
jgi:membrane associated rhomboid family serine protease